MSGPDKARVALLVGLIPVLMLSIVGNQQFNNAFPLWSQKNMDLVMFGWQVPVTWLQAVDAVVSTATMSLLSRSTIGRGVLAGAMIPYQPLISKPL